MIQIGIKSLVLVILLGVIQINSMDNTVIFNEDTLDNIYVNRIFLNEQKIIQFFNHSSAFKLKTKLIQKPQHAPDYELCESMNNHNLQFEQVVQNHIFTNQKTKVWFVDAEQQMIYVMSNEYTLYQYKVYHNNFTVITEDIMPSFKLLKTQELREYQWSENNMAKMFLDKDIGKIVWYSNDRVIYFNRGNIKKFEIVNPSYKTLQINNVLYHDNMLFIASGTEGFRMESIKNATGAHVYKIFTPMKIGNLITSQAPNNFRILKTGQETADFQPSADEDNKYSYKTEDE